MGKAVQLPLSVCNPPHYTPTFGFCFLIFFKPRTIFLCQDCQTPIFISIPPPFFFFLVSRHHIGDSFSLLKRSKIAAVTHVVKCRSDLHATLPYVYRLVIITYCNKLRKYSGTYIGNEEYIPGLVDGLETFLRPLLRANVCLFTSVPGPRESCLF